MGDVFVLISSITFFSPGGFERLDTIAAAAVVYIGFAEGLESRRPRRCTECTGIIRVTHCIEDYPMRDNGLFVCPSACYQF